MITKHSFTSSTWIELDRPTDKDIEEIAQKYDIDPRVAEDLKSLSLRQRVEVHGNYLYLVLHFPAFKHTHGEKNTQELDFIIGKDFVITVKYDTIDTLHSFSRIVDTRNILQKNAIHEHPAFIFFGLLREIYRSLVHEINYIEDTIDNIEQNIFKHKEREMVITVSKATKNLLDLKRIVDQHEEILDNLQNYGEKLFGHDFVHNVNVIRSDYFKVRHLINSNIDLVHELRETNNTLLTTKQNEVMKLFTILAFFTFPLSLIAAIFDIQSKSTPFREHPFGFWIIIAIMVLATTIMFGFFKHRRWL